MATGLLAVLVLATTASAVADRIYDVDYAGWGVEMSDSQGVATSLSDFGFWTGPNVLVARRGDAKVRIPFRRIRTLEIGKYVPVRGHSPATVVTQTGRSYKLQIEKFEGQRYLSGKSEFGSLRIQLQNIAKLRLIRLSHTDPDVNG
jgi:hypothetical protein